MQQQQDQQPKRGYNQSLRAPLEHKIQVYLTFLREGWGRNYARTQAGLRMGSEDYKRSIKDERVIAAHETNRKAFREKQKNRIT